MEYQPPNGHGFRAVAHQLAAREDAANERMRFESLKRFVRIETRIVIFEAGDHAERNAIIAKAVNPAAAIHAGIERPAQRVRHPAGRDSSFGNFPQFLDANAVDLRIDAGELFIFDQLFGERAARVPRQAR